MAGPEEYNKIRRIIFSTYHSPKAGRDKAFEFLKNYEMTLGYQGHKGLGAELNFYDQYQKEFALTVAGDMGDHTDFAGIINGTPFRFDVTTNINYKRLTDYEPLQKSTDARYKIAVIDSSGSLSELIDINFPFCPICNKGRMIDMAVLLPENFNDDGESKWTNDQILIAVCNHCEFYEEKERISTHFLNDFGTTYDQARETLLNDEGNLFYDETKITKEHATSVVGYLEKQFQTVLMALCDREYQLLDKDGDGYYSIVPKWTKDLSILEDYILDEYSIEV